MPGQVKIFILTLASKKVNMVSKHLFKLYYIFAHLFQLFLIFFVLFHDFFMYFSLKFLKFFKIFLIFLFLVEKQSCKSTRHVKNARSNRIEDSPSPRLELNIVLNVLWVKAILTII
jgi:hypothetical protein